MQDQQSAASAHPSIGPLLWLAVALLSGTALAEALPSAELADLSIEELANIYVTSASKHAEKLSQATASLYVITGDDIRRSGKTTLPEALRLAPNLQVARIDARNYAITARGLNDTFSNKMLVLIDGRVVYSPLFSGVFWDAQDVMLEDIARIEVISGPGATLWGANAVNGIINVISKHAKDTLGGLLSLDRSGLQDNASTRWGGSLPNDGYYRIYGKYEEQDNTRRANGTETATGMRRSQVGFRVDWDKHFKLQGDVYQAALKQAQTRDILTRGHNLLGRWDSALSSGATLYLQAYIDQTRRDQPNAYVDKLDTTELEFQHSQPLSEQHKLTWGAGYRQARDRIVSNTRGFAFLPAEQDLTWANVYAQDEVALTDALRLTVGLKLERNNYSGTESLPSLRMGWEIGEGRFLWGSLSRAVRAPSRIDRDFYVPGVKPYFIAGGPDFVSEVANVGELGYRGQVSTVMTYSGTLFYASYDKLRSGEPSPQTKGAVVLANKIEGHTRGIELWGNWQTTPHWRLSGGWVAQQKRLKSKADSQDKNGAQNMGLDPSHYWTLRSQHALTENGSLDVQIRRVGAISRTAISAYTAMDASWLWEPRPDLEVALVGQNLFGGHHLEFGNAVNGSVYGRELHLQLRYRF